MTESGRPSVTSRISAWQSRSWPIRAISLLLFLQAVGLISAVIYNTTRIRWIWRMGQEPPTPQTLDLLSINGVFLVLGLLALVAAVSFVFLHQGGWLLAMFVQGATLLICLIYHFRRDLAIVYPVMVYCIFLVLYLNSFNVQAAFHHGDGGNG